jgi:MFS family permease
VTSTARRDPIERISGTALLVWGIALVAYVFAVFARSSLSATGVAAALHFHTTAAQLSLFAVLQLGVYAAMQVPAGTTVDRLGPRRSIALGTALIGLGQVAIAFATGVPSAVGARVLVGAGDAFIFVSVLRLLPSWFPGRHVAVATQVTGTVGQLGQLLSLGPLVGLVHVRGWTAAFVAAGSVTLLISALAMAAIRDGAGVRSRPSRRLWRRVGEGSDGAPTLGQTWRNPGTRAGFWAHFTAQLSGNAFVMLWGFPFMTRSQGIADGTALQVLAVFVLGSVTTGPVVGVLSGRYPHRRVQLVVALVVLQILAWAAVLGWPGPAPAWLLLALSLALSTGGPASLVGFDLGRSTTPEAAMGVGTGMVNTGGFTSSLVTVLAVGVVLDLLGQGTPERFTDVGFSVAWLVQVPVWVVGLTMLARALPAYRRQVAAA